MAHSGDGWDGRFVVRADTVLNLAAGEVRTDRGARRLGRAELVAARLLFRGAGPVPLSAMRANMSDIEPAPVVHTAVAGLRRALAGVGSSLALGPMDRGTSSWELSVPEPGVARPTAGGWGPLKEYLAGAVTGRHPAGARTAPPGGGGGRAA